MPNTRAANRPTEPTEGFSIIYADPPWAYRDKCGSGKRGACFKYSVMSLQDIMAMRPFIDSIAAPDCLLAMWWVPPQPAEALAVVEAWGFELKTMIGFCWRKLTVNGHEHFGMGNWTRAKHRGLPLRHPRQTQTDQPRRSASDQRPGARALP